jgi:gliding motility-associated-like protein
MTMRYLLAFCITFCIATAARCQDQDPVALKGPDGRYLLTDAVTHRTLSPDRYDEVGTWSDGLAPVRTGSKWGYAGRRGLLAIRARFDAARPFHEGFASVRIGAGRYMIDTLGTVVSTLQPVQQPARGGTARTATSTACSPNLDFESGNFTNWQTNTGSTSILSGNNVINLSSTWRIGLNTVLRQTIVDSAAPELDWYGQFPVNAPGGGRYSLKLGNDDDGSQAEAVRYKVVVPANATDASITFSYAVVFESPSHTLPQQPRFRSKMYDVNNGEVITCASFEFAALGPLPGFVNSTRRRLPTVVVRYKSWSSVFVNLSKYAGRTLYLEFTTADCTLAGHFGYAYVDVTGCGVSATADYNCAQNKTNLKAPPGFETYQWYANNNFNNMIGTGENLVLSPNPPLGSQYSVIVKPFANTDCITCDCRDTISVAVNATFPVANAGPDRVSCSGAAVQLGNAPATTGTSYQWSPTTFLANPAASQTSASPPAAMDYVLTVTNTDNGCARADTVHVDVRPKPQVDFSAGTTPSQCLLGNAFTFSNNSSIAAGTVQYDWSFGDGTTSTQVTPSHSYAAPGIYTVRLLATSDKGCTDSLSRQVTVIASPDAGAIAGSVAQCFANNSFSFAAIAANSPSLTYSWAMGDGASYNTSSVTHQYAAAGSYPVRLLVTNSDGCFDSTRINVTVHPQPVAGFNIAGLPPGQCLNSNLYTLVNTSSVSNGSMNFSWSFGDGALSASAAPVHSYAATGSYTINLLVTSDKGCVDSSAQSVSVRAAPVAAAQVNNAGQCIVGNQFVFVNNSVSPSGSSWQWSTGDGNIFTTSGLTYSYAQPGTYSVKLLVTNADGCKDSSSIPVTVFASPQARFTLSNAAAQCFNGNNFVFSNTSTGNALQYSWSFGDGNSSPLPQPTHAYAAAGTYNIRLHISNAIGCADSAFLSVTVHAKPDPLFNIAAPQQCLRNNQFNFNSQSSIGSGSFTSSWSFGDGTAGAGGNPVHAYSAAGTYPVTLLLTSDKGCKDSVIHPVIINPDPLAGIGISNPAQCFNGNAFNFQNTSTLPGGAFTSSWNFGDGFNAASQNAAHSYTQHGTYPVTLLVVSSQGCRDSISRSVTVHPKPVPVMALNTGQQCLQGNSFVLNGSSTVASGSLTTFVSFGDGGNSSIIPAVHTYSAPGIYPVKLLVLSDKGCRDSLSQDITVHPHPVLALAGTSSLLHCEGDSAQLGISGAQTWAWAPVQGLSCAACAAPMASPRTSITYTVEGRNAFGCPSKDSVRFDVKHPIHVQANNTQLCRYDKVTMQAAGAASYLWSPAYGLSDPASASPQFVGDSSVTYRLIGRDGFGCFNDTVQVAVTVYPLPVLNAGPDLTLPAGAVQPLQVSVQNGPVSTWLWMPSLGLSCNNCGNPVLTVKQDMTYFVRATNIHGCRSIDTLHVTAFCQDAQLFIANAFTPNGDGVNDVLFVQGSGIARVKHFRVFNRWGELVYEAQNFSPNDPRVSWNGKVRGMPATPEVYVYTAEVICENKAEFTFKGNVTLLK